ncbi:hypothetical protein BB558_003405 [Smittium angustum]|uniref:Carboxymuconolactone decarboxylase-like domain-containing protein n=1 Tax=Smittium angustum TaxID=133377 RepID=A0A2U1J624_SMIAN|nr:hypothetical protein BB558_003405 [Smittium angustum]
MNKPTEFKKESNAFDFLEKYYTVLGHEFTIILAICCYIPGNYSKLAGKLFKEHLGYLLNTNKSQEFGKDIKLSTLPETKQQEIINFVKKARDAVYKCAGNTGLPLILVMLGELKEVAGTEIWSKLPTKQVIPSLEPDEPNNNTGISSTEHSKRYRVGREYFSEVYGHVGKYNFLAMIFYEKLVGRIRELHPNLEYVVMESIYGDLMSDNTVFSKEETELITVGVISHLNTPVQTYSHVRGAGRVGASEESIKATVELAKEILETKNNSC